MKIRLLLMITAIAFLCVSVSAQKEMLTKEETVNYLHKKLQEVDGRDFVTKKGVKVRNSNLSFRIIGDNLELKFTEQGTGLPAGHSIYIFDPAHISAIALLVGYEKARESPVWGLRIKFASKTVRSSVLKTTTDFSDGDVVFFPYFAAVPDNHLRIEKALLHLRDLYKAEDDPFDN